MQIKFEDPTQRLEGEGCSKRLKVDSALVKYLSRLRREMREHVTCPMMGDEQPWQIQLTGESNRELLVPRAQELQRKKVNIRIRDNYQILDEKTVVFMTPEIAGYGQTHVTIAHFPKGATNWVHSYVALCHHN